MTPKTNNEMMDKYLSGRKYPWDKVKEYMENAKLEGIEEERERTDEILKIVAHTNLFIINGAALDGWSVEKFFMEQLERET